MKDSLVTQQSVTAVRMPGDGVARAALRPFGRRVACRLMARAHRRLEPKSRHGPTRGGLERRRLLLSRGASKAMRRLDGVQPATQLNMGDKDVPCDT